MCGPLNVFCSKGKQQCWSGRVCACVCAMHHSASMRFTHTFPRGLTSFPCLCMDFPSVSLRSSESLTHFMLASSSTSSKSKAACFILLPPPFHSSSMPTHFRSTCRTDGDPVFHWLLLFAATSEAMSTPACVCSDCLLTVCLMGEHTGARLTFVVLSTFNIQNCLIETTL